MRYFKCNRWGKNYSNTSRNHNWNTKNLVELGLKCQFYISLQESVLLDTWSIVPRAILQVSPVVLLILPIFLHVWSCSQVDNGPWKNRNYHKKNWVYRHKSAVEWLKLSRTQGCRVEIPYLHDKQAVDLIKYFVNKASILKTDIWKTSSWT